jgi:hypothetical protein
LWPDKKFFFTKPQYLNITNNEKVQDSKSEPNKNSLLRTFELKYNFTFIERFIPAIPRVKGESIVAAKKKDDNNLLNR